MPRDNDELVPSIWFSRKYDSVKASVMWYRGVLYFDLRQMLGTEAKPGFTTKGARIEATVESLDKVIKMLEEAKAKLLASAPVSPQPEPTAAQA